MSSYESITPRGCLSWMVYNRVTPNLLMVFLILGGFFMSFNIKKEVFPSFDLDQVYISIVYPGASPREVEQSIVLAVEEAVQGIDGVEEINATAFEGNASISVQVRNNANPQNVLQEIQRAVDRISVLPSEAEDPLVSLVAVKIRVLQLIIFGDVSEQSLNIVAEQVRDKLLQATGISQVENADNRNYEIEVAVPMEKLRAYNLTIAQIANIINAASIDSPVGKLETVDEGILLRVKNRRNWAGEFAKIPIITNERGSIVYLEDIAEVRENFEDTVRFTTFNQHPSRQLHVYRVGDQTPITVSEAVHRVMTEIENDLPSPISWAITADHSTYYKQRLHLLLKNAFIGLLLVLFILGIFLELKLAFWVTMGIPISFLGGLLFLPFFDVSINMISMFAFIVALGIVVDDAIIAGENIYEYRQRGLTYIEAAIEGVKDVATPISISILTNIIAFLPLAFVPGVMGKVWRVIPLVVVVVFLISWIEALFILPAHLAHSRRKKGIAIMRVLGSWQQTFARMVLYFIHNIYGPFIDRVLSLRYITTSLLIAIMIVTVFYVKSGRISLILTPRVESNQAFVAATLPHGSSVTEMFRVHDYLIDSLEKVAKENGGENLLESIDAVINDNMIYIMGNLTAPDIRQLDTATVTKLWRQEAGPVSGVESLSYEYDHGGFGSGAAISITLSHRDSNVLSLASAAIAERVKEFPTVKDVDKGSAQGRVQFNFTINEWGESLGLTSTEIARQIRNGFQGVIALRQQRGNNEVMVKVRLPQQQRMSEFDIESFLISTPAKTFVPLREIATVERDRAYISITRHNSRRTVVVSADVDPIGHTPVVLEAIEKKIIPEITRMFPGLTYSYQGRQDERQRSMSSLFSGFLFALGGIYCLLAILFRSYLQPIMIMVAIPFGIIGAVFGHIIMNYDLSLMSMMGVVALSGVVVNDSLILVDYANKQMMRGYSSAQSIRNAGIRRFRPVLLTTMTTFCSLAPMIFETSMQARFLIPMVISLGFGIIFATIITLVLIPCLFLIIEDIRRIMGRLIPLGVADKLPK